LEDSKREKVECQVAVRNRQRILEDFLLSVAISFLCTTYFLAAEKIGKASVFYGL
jgi:hypothetical protein